MTLPTAINISKALESLDKLEHDVKNAPSFKVLNSAAATAAAMQKTFKPVKEVADRAGEIWTIAEIKLAEELEKLPKAIGTRNQITGKASGKGNPHGKRKAILTGGAEIEPPVSAPTLAELGVDKKRSSRAKQLKAIPKKQRDNYIVELKKEGKGITPDAILKKNKEGNRKKKRASYSARVYSGKDINNLTTLIETGQKFGTIYADPPWTFKVYSDKGKDRSAERHYDTMSLKAIAALPVAELADDNCTLLLWAIMPELPGALEIIKAWGFTFKTVGFVWVKQNKSGEGLFTGMGYWTRANAEMCLLATKGSPTRLHMDVHQIIMAPIGKHSEKPDEVRSRIERLVPGPYLELFARTSAEKWTTWGNEI